MTNGGNRYILLKCIYKIKQLLFIFNSFFGLNCNNNERNKMNSQSDDAIVNIESVALCIRDRIVAEPAHKVVLYKMLSSCKEPRTFLELEAEVLAFPEMKVPLQTVQVLLSWLLGCEGIKEIVKNEAPSLWVTTDAGLLALEKELKEDKLEALFMNEPTYKTIYLMVLNFCKDAKSRMEIEAHLEGQPLLENPKIYASYFIDTLETAGALVWNGSWNTTQKAYAKL